MGGFVWVRSKAFPFRFNHLGGFVPQNNGLFCLCVFGGVGPSAPALALANLRFQR
jgi:hypothetical protein